MNQTVTTEFIMSTTNPLAPEKNERHQCPWQNKVQQMKAEITFVSCFIVAMVLEF